MFNINNNLDIITYGAAVREIAANFFNDDGEYIPYLGNANAMVVFFNYFVVSSKYDEVEPKDFNVDALYSDEEFLAKYNEALKGDGTVRFNFSNAYKDAMDIVNLKKTSLGYAVDMIKKVVVDLGEKFAPLLTESTIDKINNISENIAKGDLSPEVIGRVLGESLG